MRYLSDTTRTAPAASPGPSTTGRDCAASSSSAPRAAATTRRERALTRENAQAVERCIEADGPRAVTEIVARQRRRPRAEERPGDLRAGDRRGRGDERDAPGRARGAAGGRAAPARTCSTSRRSSRASAAGAAACAAPSALVRRAAAGRARVPGGQVPPARRLDAPRPAAPGAPAERVTRQPDARVSTDHARLFEWSPAAARPDGLPRMVEGFVARAGGRDARGGRGARPRVPASRARLSRPST